MVKKVNIKYEVAVAETNLALKTLSAEGKISFSEYPTFSVYPDRENLGGAYMTDVSVLVAGQSCVMDEDTGDKLEDPEEEEMRQVARRKIHREKRLEMSRKIGDIFCDYFSQRWGDKGVFKRVEHKDGYIRFFPRPGSVLIPLR